MLQAHDHVTDTSDAPKSVKTKGPTNSTMIQQQWNYTSHVRVGRRRCSSSCVHDFSWWVRAYTAPRPTCSQHITCLCTHIPANTASPRHPLHSTRPKLSSPGSVSTSRLLHTHLLAHKKTGRRSVKNPITTQTPRHPLQQPDSTYPTQAQSSRALPSSHASACAVECCSKLFCNRLFKPTRAPVRCLFRQPSSCRS